MADRKDVFTIRERKDGKKFWLKIGSAFVNKDGSLSVRLDALPLDGTLHIREPKEWDNDREPSRKTAARGSQQGFGDDGGGDEIPF